VSRPASADGDSRGPSRRTRRRRAPRSGGRAAASVRLFKCGERAVRHEAAADRSTHPSGPYLLGLTRTPKAGASPPSANPAGSPDRQPTPIRDVDQRTTSQMRRGYLFTAEVLVEPVEALADELLAGGACPTRRSRAAFSFSASEKRKSGTCDDSTGRMVVRAVQHQTGISRG